jgi:hypothetical protein
MALAGLFFDRGRITTASNPASYNGDKVGNSNTQVHGCYQPVADTGATGVFSSLGYG